MTNFDAKPIIDSSDSIVEAGRIIAAQVNRLLEQQPEVAVSLKGVMAASSSFFNILFLEVFSAHGEMAVRSRLIFEYNSRIQEDVAKRSLAAVLAAKCA